VEWSTLVGKVGAQAMKRKEKYEGNGPDDIYNWVNLDESLSIICTMGPRPGIFFLLTSLKMCHTCDLLYNNSKLFLNEVGNG
jgi:hypothetical protein